jgi:hypothetical protein
VSAELAARCTAAAAVLADYGREVDEANETGHTELRLAWPVWAGRLASALRSLLEQLDTDPTSGQLEQVRLVLDQVFGDEYADRQYALEEIDDILRGTK